MPYQVTLSNQTVLTNVADSAIDTTSTSLTLVGRNYPGYGQYIANDLVRLLENAASSTAPAAPLVGQIWYNSATGLLNVCTRNTPGSIVWVPQTTGVATVVGLTGNITLSQLAAAGVAPLSSPTFTGVPAGPTATSGTNSTQLATCGFVTNALGAVVAGVSSVAGLTGSISLAALVSAGVAPTASPVLSGVPTAPTPSVGNNSTQIATTAFVYAQVGALSTGVSSVLSYNGAVTLSQLVTGGLAPLASPILTGTPTAPTAAISVTSNQVATCAFVNAVVTALPKTRVRLTGNLNIYVSTTGSDSTLTGSSSAPFLTLQAAYNFLANTYDLAGYTAAINVANGTYTNGVTASGPLVGQNNGFPVYITGNNASPSSVIINSSTAQVNTFNSNDAAFIQVQSMTLNSAGSGQGGWCLVAQTGGIVAFTNVIFGAAVQGHMITNYGGFLQCVGNYSIAGSAPSHINVSNNGAVEYDGSGGAFTIAVSVFGSPNFPSGFISGYGPSSAIFSGTTFSGAATGYTYQIAYGTFIDTSGGGPNFFPGSAAGLNNQGYYL